MNIFILINFTTVFSSFEQSWHYIILGIIHVITEVFPISSTAHLKVIPLLLGWEEPGVSVVASLQLGSMVALMTYFWKDICFILGTIQNFRFSRSWKNKRQNY